MHPLNLCRRGIAANRDGTHKKKGRLRSRKRPKSREETPKEGSDSGALPHTPQIRRSLSAAQLNVGVKGRYEGL